MKTALNEVEFGSRSEMEKSDWSCKQRVRQSASKGVHSRSVNRKYAQSNERVFISLPILEYGNYCLISLIRHITRIMIQGAMRRIHEVCKERCGFMREIVAPQMLLFYSEYWVSEKSVELQTAISLSYITRQLLIE